ncbi:type VII secretion protein EccB [Kineosporia babensis]|uniref:Type VII secretion protein EccB n=1 Tax=Kineosporia babensis TaxID=499548 RepID=A0A9X1NB20_9ACTN|nr:type VII secretion protein EccB [Kineosporia babensis]MCD5309996.1 type VII secretion protein EccB [Kineosporia babensis]
MASRKDLLDSYQFAARRVVSAAVVHETDPTEWPYRRLGGAGMGAVMITVIALAVAGIYGMIRPGGKTSWRDGSSVILVKETGATYVYLDGKLHLTPNFTSAALLAGTTTKVSTSTKSLAEVPRGPELGIADAPANLPVAADLVAPPWSFCTQQVWDTSNSELSRSWMLVGERPDAGTEIADAGLLVRTPSGTLWLIWQNMRFEIPDEGAARSALNLGNQVIVPVGEAWLEALPVGRPIAPIVVPRAGQASKALPKARIGQVRKVTSSSGTQYFLTLASRLSPITELQASLQNGAGAAVKKATPADVSAAGQTALRTATDPPAQAPDFVALRDSKTVACASWENGEFVPKISVESEVPVDSGLNSALQTATVSANGTSLADRVWVEPGKATLVQSRPSPESTSGPLYLVTDQGIRYAVPSDAVLSSLGLSGQESWSLPAAVIARIPEGPALDPQVALAALHAQEEIKDMLSGG